MQYDFQFIISPFNKRQFIDDYYEQQPLVIERNDSKYYNSILTLGDVNDIIGSYDITYPNTFLVKESEGPSPSEYSYNIAIGNRPEIKGVIEKDNFISSFYNGNTIVLNFLERNNRNVQNLCHIAEKFFHCRAQANVYLTPFNSQGFKAHWDTHDVFILQINGSKKWRLYASAVELPSKKQPFKGQLSKGNPTHEFTLRAGDLLYIPRGFVHEGESTDEISIHITLGIHTYKYSDIVFEVLKDIEDTVFFRQSIPLELDMQQEIIEKLQRNLISYFNEEQFKNALAKIKESFISKRLPDTTDRLFDYIALKNLNGQSVLKRRKRIFYDLTANDSEIHLRFYNKLVKLPKIAERSVDYILRNDTFKVSDIDDSIAEEGKLNLCKKLIEEGFLKIDTI